MPTIDLGPNALTGQLAPTLKKPPFLITLIPNGMKATGKEFFISLDKPESINGFVQVKGIFCDKKEDEIIKDFSDILTSTGKELIIEMMFPLHRIYHIRSLVFSAVKNVTPVTVGK